MQPRPNPILTRPHVIDDIDLQRFLEPLIEHWNRLEPDELRAMHDVRLFGQRPGRLSYVTEGRTPFGYDYVEFEIRNQPEFAMRIRIEGRPGDLSMMTYLPVVTVDGDKAACSAWLLSRRSAS